MSGRNRGPPLPMKGVCDALYGRECGPMPHPALYEEMRESQYGMVHIPLLPPHPPIFEERLAAQHQDIQAFLVDNQRLAATHIALKQELEVTQHELQRMAHLANLVRVKKDVQMRDLVELQQVNGNIKELNATSQELMGETQAMTQDLTRITTAAIDFEKKGYAENYDHGQMMEKKLISMARELEKLHAEMANAENRARASAAVGNTGYIANYGNIEAYLVAGNYYLVNYGMNLSLFGYVYHFSFNFQVQSGAESFPYGAIPGSWVCMTCIEIRDT
ncbi:hypothetical protein UlMin_008848 [Ulmus minor]